MILIGTDDGIYRWVEGAGWPVFHSLQGRAVVGLDSPGQGVLAALDRSGEVLESTDNGMSWRILPLPAGAGRPSALAFEGTPPSLAVALKPLNLYRRGVGTPVPKGELAGTGFAPRVIRQASGLARGATALIAPRRVRPPSTAEAIRLAGWTSVSAPKAPKTTVAPEVRLLAVVPGGSPVWLAAVSGAGLWKSEDGGRAWSQCAGLPSEVYAVRAVAGRPGHVWAATDDGCRFSADGGQTWEDRSAGLEAVRHARAIEVKPGEPDVLLAGVAPRGPVEAGAAPRNGLNFALYESTNGGKSWALVRRNFPEALEYDAIADIRFDPSYPDNAVVALGSGELWVTRNGGAYWGPLARQIRAARVLCAVG